VVAKPAILLGVGVVVVAVVLVQLGLAAGAWS
jgi:hypothetical protein